MSGTFQIVLHAHLPFVRHPENDVHLEEAWLFEAISETYLPLLDACDALDRDAVPGRFAISLSQPLIAMLDDELLRERFERHLTGLVALAESERDRTAGDPVFEPLATWYHDRFTHQLERYRNRWRRDLAGAFAGFHQTGRIELFTCVGTHGSLPLMLRDASRRAQIVTAAEHFAERFGFTARGMWMGECAYWPGVDKMLADAGVRFSFVDGHGIERASSPPVRGLFAPIVSDHGVAFFGRDPDSSSQVWSSEEGYPGDPNYREFYRDVGFDLPADYIAPWIHPDGIRVHTGVKYYRVTGEGDDKKPWNPGRAFDVARAHARHYVWCREQQLAWASERLDVAPHVTSPYDAELFGHWWFEGPWFLEHVLREAAQHPHVSADTPGAYLERVPVQQIAEPSPSSWGENGYFGVWLNPRNAWMHRGLQRGELVLQQAVDRYRGTSARADRALRQAARELLLAQSSDWAFIVTTDTAVEYAEQRTRQHLANLDAIADGLGGDDPDGLDALVAALEDRSPIFPKVRPELWASTP